ncbi:NAD/ferredoxin-dependent reductase-like protein [Streptomyces sp. Amel2xB2]|uniref:NAD(P)/FAD-dependent oxidoreductase n=1 Tax=Streptomyces sp. Amel2xB2 TaxID=1305829 RepID=UPI000DB97139|nr:FAD/NAD(P)-binding oxidoreductase [Streptomyces sp. Amel2xB2]RAJ69908.1 NAD/ferredoxin-dependent reductase-like protein [Streptomyces sp. Amel2xB2]
MSDVLVIGASAAGLATAEALRRRGFGGTVRLVGAEPHPPYDRPPLSKQVLLGDWEADRTVLRPPGALADLGIETTLGRRAVSLDTARREVALDDGTSLPYGDLVLATGLTPRRIGAFAEQAGVHTVRTLEDTGRLRAELAGARRLSVIGGGVLGCEIAASARRLGLDVTVIDPAPVPMADRVGPEIGAMLAELHRDHGIVLMSGAEAEAPVVSGGRIAGVRTSKGTVEADVVVVAVGSTPTTEWLEGSGLTLDDGVVCDARCRAARHVYAVGDVARWWHEGQGRYVRLENRSNATEQALAVAGNILGADRPYLPVPYFWTDQHGIRMQVLGRPAEADRIRMLERTPDPRKFVAVAEAGERPVGVVGWNSARGLRRARALLTDGSRPH